MSVDIVEVITTTGPRSAIEVFVPGQEDGPDEIVEVTVPDGPDAVEVAVPDRPSIVEVIVPEEDGPDSIVEVVVPGVRGEPGLPGPAGPPGPVGEPDVPSLTLIFENGLI